MENTYHYDQAIPEERPTSTLDSVRSLNSLPTPDFVKLDTQGSEIDILKGSVASIEKTKFIYIECSVLGCNHGAPRLADYLVHLESIGFVPYDLCEEHRMNGALVQIDILFVRKEILAHLGGKEVSRLLF